MRRGSDVYHSKDYKRVKCRNSYTVKYFSNQNEIAYAQVIFFFQVQTPEAVRNLALVTPLQKKEGTLHHWGTCITHPNDRKTKSRQSSSDTCILYHSKMCIHRRH